MKVTAKNVLDYGGCRGLHRFHIKTYGRGASVDYEQIIADLKAYSLSVPEGTDLSWIDWTLEEWFRANHKAIENCGEVVVYHDVYKSFTLNTDIIEDSVDNVKAKAREIILEYMKSPEEFFRVQARYKDSLFGQEGIGIYDIDDPRTVNLTLIDYMLTKPDGKNVYVKTLEEFNNTLKSLEEEYIAYLLSNLNIYQKIVADDKYDAWKPIS